MIGSGSLASLLVPLRILFFVAFFTGTAIAYYYRDRFHLRQLYVCTFFVCVLAVGVTSVAFPPVDDLHKFPGSGPTEATDYEITAVDSAGEEVLFDVQAIEPVPPSRQSRLGSTLLDDCNETERRHVAASLLAKFRDYRKSIRDDSMLSAASIEFPRDEFGYQWTADNLDSYGTFDGLRVYEVHRTLTEDGSAIANSSREMMYEYTADSPDVEPGNHVRRRPICS